MGPMAIAEPLAPQTVQETHVPKGLLEELALKLLVLEGGLNILDLAERICLSLPITEELCQDLRKDHLCEVKGTLGRYYWLAPTDKGRAQASELFSRNQYAGPAPVTLTEYDIRVHSQSIQQSKVTPVDLARALHGLVLIQRPLRAWVPLRSLVARLSCMVLRAREKRRLPRGFASFTTTRSGYPTPSKWTVRL